MLGPSRHGSTKHRIFRRIYSTLVELGVEFSTAILIWTIYTKIPTPGSLIHELPTINPPLTNKYQFLFHLQVGLFVRMLAVADCCQIVSSLQPSLVEVSIAHVRRVVSRVLVLYVLQRRSILILFCFALLFLLIALWNSRVMRLRYNATISPFR